jgi:uncharacterized protein (DUF2132 family)
VERYGWEEMASRIRINCFSQDPSLKSSLAFLRKTPWARDKVEQLYLTSIGAKPSQGTKPKLAPPLAADPKSETAVRPSPPAKPKVNVWTAKPNEEAAPAKPNEEAAPAKPNEEAAPAKPKINVWTAKPSETRAAAKPKLNIWTGKPFEEGDR